MRSHFFLGAPGMTAGALVLFFLGFFVQNGLAQYVFKDEYQAKAVYLYNFAKYTTWDTKALPKDSTTFVIGILGTDPWQGMLTNILNKPINRRTIVVEKYTEVKEAEKCHLLFISKSERNRIKQILSQLENKAVLTVGETDRFTQLGGMIYCYVVEKKKEFEPKFDLNEAAAAQAKLTPGLELLEGAVQVIRSNK